MLRARLNKLYAYRKALAELALKQFRVKYAGSRLGIWWALLVPLMLAASINFVFSAAFKVSIDNFAIFILAGIMPWFYFQNALTEAANSFLSSRDILKQSLLPRELIPVSTVLSSLLNFFIGFCFLLPIFIIINPAVLKLLPVLLVIIFLQTLFMAGLSILFACLNVFFRDLNHILSVAFMVWFWVTPVFYSVEMLDTSYRWVCVYNPMTYFIYCYQRILFFANMPSGRHILILICLAAAALTAGYSYYCKTEQRLLKSL